MEGRLTRPGAHAASGDDLRAQQRAMAARVIRTVRSMYGPGGGHAVLDGDPPRLLTSGASALREQPGAPPEAAPYLALAADVQRHGGDQATGALLLAAGIVRRALDATARTPVILDGLQLARRQARAWLAAHAEEAQATGALGAVGGPDPEQVLEGLRRIADARRIDLDHVEIAHDVRERPAWSDGLVVRPAAPHGRRRMRDARVLIVGDGLPAPRTDASYRLAAGAAMAAQEMEDARADGEARRAVAAGVGLVACRKKVPDRVRDRLLDQGVLVLEDCPASTAFRLEAGTGAAQAPDLAHWGSADLGRADLERRPPRRGGWTVRGPGPSATLLLPTTLPAHEAAAADDAERMLRAAGLVLTDPSALPGGGRWQRMLAADLRRTADHAPGQAPLGIQMVADAVDALADDLVRNLGGDPLSTPVPEDATGVQDAAACVRLAVTAALDTAIQVLRLDGRHDKRPSRGEDLRGGAGPAGSPKGMPGDIPPLM